VSPQCGISLPKHAAVTLPKDTVSLFHVEQCPVQGLSTIAGAPIENVCGIAGHDLDRETSRQVGKPLHLLPLQVYPVVTLKALHPDRDGAPTSQSDSADEAKR